jgi:4'-phosphopantetheinyl transferase
MSTLVALPRADPARSLVPEALEHAHVHVVQVGLDPPTESVRRLAAVLSLDERTRARRFVAERDRRRFVVARGALRTVLGECVGERPERIRLVSGTHGKPALAWPTGSPLRFNIAHSGGRALIALAHGREVGVDLERIRLDLEFAELAGLVFSDPERAALARLPDRELAAGFFACWVRKESYVKAIGEGLSCPLGSFDVSVRPDRPAALLTCRRDAREVSRWQMRDLDAGPGYAAAITVAGHGWRLTPGIPADAASASAAP